jgi:hypothetical protein
MCYPTDGRSLSLIGKAICGFAHLLHVHLSVIVARVIVKVLVNSEQDIPDDFVISVGEAPVTRSFTVPVFILSAMDFAVGGDEELPPADGQAHHLPFLTPRWLYPPAAASASSSALVGDVEQCRSLAM